MLLIPANHKNSQDLCGIKKRMSEELVGNLYFLGICFLVGQMELRKGEKNSREAFFIFKNFILKVTYQSCFYFTRF